MMSALEEQVRVLRVAAEPRRKSVGPYTTPTYKAKSPKLRELEGRGPPLHADDLLSHIQDRPPLSARGGAQQRRY